MHGLILSRFKFWVWGAIFAAMLASDRCTYAQNIGRSTELHRISSTHVTSGRAGSLIGHSLTTNDQIPTWSAALEHRGRQRIDYAYDLASRGAVHSAQQELFNVLGMVAQTLDTDQGTQRHGEALFSAQVALEEADDFLKAGPLGARPRNVAAIAASHRTTLLRQADSRQITPVVALQHYFSHAGQQFAVAAGGQRVAAEALFGLGRVIAMMRDHPLTTEAVTSSLSEQKMLLFYKAAGAVDPRNHRAANELGVLLSRFNQWEQACQAFECSVAQTPELQNCLNLAIAYERLGEQELSAQMRRYCEALSREISAGHSVSTNASTGRVAPAVEWVDLETFAQSGAPAGWNSQAVDKQSRNGLGEVAKPNAARTIHAGHSKVIQTPSQPDRSGGLLTSSPLKRLKAVFQRSRRAAE